MQPLLQPASKRESTFRLQNMSTEKKHSEHSRKHARDSPVTPIHSPCDSNRDLQFGSECGSSLLTVDQPVEETERNEAHHCAKSIPYHTKEAGSVHINSSGQSPHYQAPDHFICKGTDQAIGQEATDCWNADDYTVSVNWMKNADTVCSQFSHDMDVLHSQQINTYEPHHIEVDEPDGSVLPVHIPSSSTAVGCACASSSKRFCYEERKSGVQRAASSSKEVTRVLAVNAYSRNKTPRVTFDRRLTCTIKYLLSKDLAVASMVAEPQRDVKFSVTSCHTYGVQLKPGDILVLWINSDCEYTDDGYLIESKGQLSECSYLSADEMRSYLDGSIECNKDYRTDLATGLLQRISECPGPWKFIISQYKLDADIILRVINSVIAVSKSEKKKQQNSVSEFFQNISVQPFLFVAMLGAMRQALKHLQCQEKLSMRLTCSVQPSTAVESINSQLVDASVSLCFAVKRRCPQLISSLLPLVKLHIDFDSPFCDNGFLFHLLEWNTRSNYQDISSHWSQLSLLPTNEEIKLSTQRQLPRVRKTAAYSSVDSYLNTYTILYREDRLFQLRDTLANLVKGTTNPKELDAYVLPDIRVTGVQRLKKYPGLAVIMGVDRNLKTKSPPHWHRRLKQSDLVACILNGDFDHILYATVMSVFSTSMGSANWLDCFSVVFLTEENDEFGSIDILNQLIQTRNILTVLCPTYYCDFKPVLEAIQNRNPDVLPFKQELVSCVFEFHDRTRATGEDVTATQAKLPSINEYFQPCHSTESSEAVKSIEALTGTHMEAVDRDAMDDEDTIDEGTHTIEQSDGNMVTINADIAKETFTASRAFRRLKHLRFQRSDKYKRTFLPSFIQPGETCIDWTVVFKEELKTSSSSEGLSFVNYRRYLQSANFDILRQLFTSDLDESQLDAVELALHNRVTVIQGPPGTGKTFIGYKLVQLLLSVSTLPKGPIVVLANKNHILNEFLKGCGEFCGPTEEVVRVGGKKQDVVGNVVHLSASTCQPHSHRYGVHPAEKWRDICDIVPAVIEHLPGEMLRSIIGQNPMTEFEQPDDALVAALSNLDHVSDSEMKRLLLHTAKEWPFTYRSKHSPYASIYESYDCIDPDSHCMMMSCIASACAIRSVAFQMEHWFQNDQIIRDLLMEKTKFINKQAEKFLSKLRAAFIDYNIPVDDDDPVDVNTGVVEHELHTDQEREHVFFSAKQTDRTKEDFWLTADISSVPPTQLPLESLQWKLSQYCVQGDMTWKRKAEFIQTLLQLHCKKHVETFKQEMTEFILKTETGHGTTAEWTTLPRAKVIGMTMTGAAINHRLIDSIKPSVVIIEEAGEVLETQVIAALSPFVQHLILIGDHKQLRPLISSYKLEKQHNFNVSLLERLILNGHYKVTLTHQSRMLREFVPLLSCIYDSLETNRDAIKYNRPTACLAESMYFWNHDYPEEKVGTSFRNDSEAEMLVHTVLWCILQSRDNRVHPSQVTIIAMYRAQVDIIRRKLRSFHKRNELLAECFLDQDVNRQQGENQTMTPFIKVFSVDQYQGDENDFVFVSLVRSNNGSKMGYVKNIDRLCVACSRARSGLYFFGNSDFIEQNGGPHWEHVVNCFHRRYAVGRRFPVRCPRHPDSAIPILNWKDFQVDKIRGTSWEPTLCHRICDQPMRCQLHVCKKKCHPHFGHEMCFVEVSKTLPCAHSILCRCWESETDIECVKCSVDTVV